MSSEQQNKPIEAVEDLPMHDYESTEDPVGKIYMVLIVYCRLGVGGHEKTSQGNGRRSRQAS